MEKRSVLDELAVLAQFFPSEEKIEWARWETPFTEEVDVLYVYGFSPHIEPLLQWVKQRPDRELVFIEDRMAVIHQMEKDLLEDPQVHFKFCFDELASFISEVVAGFAVERIAVLSLHDNRERFAEVRQLLMRKTTLETALHAEMLHYHKLVRNLLPNFQRIDGSFDLIQWKDKFVGTPAIVCGAGPSLELVKGQLAEMEDKALILAGGSTIAALTNLGVKPHLLYAIDPNPEEFHRLAWHTAYDVPLIFGCRVEPNIFYAHAGPLGYLSTGTGGGLEKWIEEQTGIKDSNVLEGLGEEAMSVTTIAFMTALYLGCNPIILAGVDLSYDQGKRYAGGIEAEPLLGQKVGDLHLEEGGHVTMTKWLMERDVLDAVCEQYPDRKFMKATGKGLAFKNIPYDPTWHNIEKIEDLRSKIHTLVMQTKRSVDVQKPIAEFFASLQRCKELVEKILQTDQSLLLELDLEEEVAFQVALKPALYALTFPIQRKRRGALLDEIQKELYRHLHNIIEEYKLKE